MAVFDATALLYFLEPDARAPLDPTTDSPVGDAKARINFLIRTIENRRETIVIPTPALSGVLVHAGDAGPRHLEIPNITRCFRVEPFDQRAAAELASMTRHAILAGDLRAGADVTRATLKFDRQIIAIARTQGETTICSDDGGIATLAKTVNLEVVPVYATPSTSGTSTEKTRPRTARRKLNSSSAVAQVPALPARPFTRAGRVSCTPRASSPRGRFSRASASRGAPESISRHSPSASRRTADSPSS